MRNLRSLAVPQDGNDIEFPDGQIRNESLTEQGTPVVREIYGDVITNVYKIIRDTNIAFNGLEDGESNGYQLLEAFKVFVNNLNDKRQVLTVSSPEITAGFNFDNLPDEYVFIGQVSDALDKNVSYNLNSGAGGANSYPVSLTSDIEASSTVIVVLNASGSSIIGINAAAESSTLNTSFGTPLSFNESSKLYYFDDAQVYDDTPQAYNTQSIIQAFASNLNIILLDAMLFKGRLLCLTLDTVLTEYRIFSFLATDLSTVEGEVTFTKTSGSDNFPYWYCDGSFIYFTNTASGSINDSSQDYSISKQDFNETLLTLTQTSAFDINTAFEKTTNAFMDASNIYTFIQGILTAYALSGATATQIAEFAGLDGLTFKLEGSTYYSNGSVATKWSY